MLILIVIAAWFFGSFPIAIGVGKLIAAGSDRDAELNSRNAALYRETQAKYTLAK